MEVRGAAEELLEFVDGMLEGRGLFDVRIMDELVMISVVEGAELVVDMREGSAVVVKLSELEGVLEARELEIELEVMSKDDCELEAAMLPEVRVVVSADDRLELAELEVLEAVGLMSAMMLSKSLL